MWQYLLPILGGAWGGYAGVQALAGDAPQQIESINSSLSTPWRIAGTLVGVGPGAALGYYMSKSAPEYRVPYMLLGSAGGGLLGYLLGSTVRAIALGG